ncbi:hypothetical protein Thal_1395 [Thermocrinis albus DSM 14484]|uniref:Uncharacterized protein n=1 Tax=Thermocrinis albus (strain DSM 14484 / JCM 11386 / HI 11/12) TaxID=638303 RepID=D3SMP4_THEAH|nr:hypothetical protein [Thermocrinis albus]ADC90024.1 hypothetical protein Thal_1395 [Thermocrinis albus DSM 14484]
MARVFIYLVLFILLIVVAIKLTSENLSKTFISRESNNCPVKNYGALVVDLNGDGIMLLPLESSNAMFDLTGSGFANKVGWISKGEAFLVWDKNEDGNINDISELFGGLNQSGFALLATYDFNKDGKIDSHDEIFFKLKLWRDSNGDGRTDKGELFSLSDAGIKSINLNPKQVDINRNGNKITEISKVELENGKQLSIAHVNFQVDRLYSYYNRDVKLVEEVIGLPWIKGYGFLPDLPIAMSLDSTLLKMVKDATEEQDLIVLLNKFERIIYRWAKVDAATPEELGLHLYILQIDRTNRMVKFLDGEQMKIEQLGAISRFSGENFFELRCKGNTLDSRKMTAAWNTMFAGLLARFAVETEKVADVILAYYDFYVDRIVLEDDFNIEEFEKRVKELLYSGDQQKIAKGFLALIIMNEHDSKRALKLIKKLKNQLPQEVLSNPYATYALNLD